MMDDESLGCAAALWVFWRWILGGDGRCLRWVVAALLCAASLVIAVLTGRS